MANAKKEFEFWKGETRIHVRLTEDGKFETIFQFCCRGEYPEDGPDCAQRLLKSALNFDERQFKEMASCIRKNSEDYFIICNVVWEKITEIESEINEANKRVRDLRSVV